MSRRISVLVVDDEPRILRFVRTELESDGYRVLVANSGRQAIELHDSERPALVILDLIMPDVDGFEVLRRIRVSARTPVIVLTARGSDVDKIRGLDLGADDYLTKPFNPGGALSADACRASAARRPGSPLATRQMFTLSNLQVDLERRRVTVDGGDVPLSPTEWQLLANLLQNARAGDPARGPARDDLGARVSERVFSTCGSGSSPAAAQAWRKLERDPGRIKTVPGVGYTIREPDEAHAADEAGDPVV